MRPLTEAEFRLMCHLSAGKSREEVARGLCISKATLMDRITTIRVKLDANTFDDALTAFAKVYVDVLR